MKLGVVFALLVGALATAPYGGAAGRDDTAWLQARLDAGGAVFLPKLPNGQCYATRGLWVSRDDTAISSDGACVVALGPGAARIKTGTARPVRANAVFFLNHSSIFDPLPARMSIDGLRIIVPAATRMHGVSISGNEVMLDHLTVSGAPLTDVLIGGGVPGAAGMTERIAVQNSDLSGGKRDVISASGPIGLRIEGNTLARAHGAGVHIRAADRGQPTLAVHIAGNTIVGNAGPGIFLDLDPKNGSPVLASGIEISGNRIVGNARTAPVSRRAGIVVAGGQDDGAGQLLLRDNDLRGNRGGALKRVQSAASRRSGNPSRVGRLRPRPAAGPIRDDTSWLQTRLDAGGGRIFLPKLPDGECYATRGLWVSRDDTRITSDGACIVSLGPGAVRLRSIDGDAIAANAVFFVNRSTPKRPAPARVTIENLRIVVPDGEPMYGVAVFGHEVTLSHLDIGGAPKDDVLIGGRANGNGYVARVSVLDSTLSGAKRNAISAFGVIGLRIEHDTIQGVRDLPPGQPAAGIDVEPDDRAQPTLDVRMLGNTIQDNAGPGILLELESNSGAAAIASDLEISGNTIVRNALGRTAPKRAGIVIAGGQDGGEGTLLLARNVIRDNGGPGILATRLKLVVQAVDNDLSSNSGGPSSGLG